MSKEKKLEKKAAKAAKKAEKLEAAQAAGYAKLVKKIEKKNVKLEKKAQKKGKPFVPIDVPTQEEAIANMDLGRGKKIATMIILILLIWYLIYFMVMWINYQAPFVDTSDEDVVQVYDRYSNPHEITQTPIYQPAQAQEYLKQVLHDSWRSLGYTSDVSSQAISYTSNIVNINNNECYVFSAAGRSWYVSNTLSSCYYIEDGEYVPITFEGTNHLFVNN